MPIRIVLIEDSATIRDNLIPAMAEMADAEVVAIAAGEQEALALLAANDWQVAVIDLFLAQGSGMGVLRALQGRRPDQHALVLTNYPNPEVRRRCMALGAEGVFDKSTELEAFFDRCLSYSS